MALETATQIPYLGEGVIGYFKSNVDKLLSTQKAPKEQMEDSLVVLLDQYREAKVAGKDLDRIEFTILTRLTSLAHNLERAGKHNYDAEYGLAQQIKSSIVVYLPKYSEVIQQRMQKLFDEVDRIISLNRLQTQFVHFYDLKEALASSDITLQNKAFKIFQTFSVVENNSIKTINLEQVEARYGYEISGIIRHFAKYVGYKYPGSTINIEEFIYSIRLFMTAVNFDVTELVGATKANSDKEITKNYVYGIFEASMKDRQKTAINSYELIAPMIEGKPIVWGDRTIDIEQENEVTQRYVKSLAAIVFTDVLIEDRPFAVNPEFMTKLDNLTKNQSDSEKRKSMNRAKEIFTDILILYYDRVAEDIQDHMIEVWEKRAQLLNCNYEMDPETPRDNSVVFAIGDPGAGKGTTLNQLQVETIFGTGTDYLFGLGKGYEQFEDVLLAFKWVMESGRMINSRIVKLLSAAVMLAKRAEFDSAGMQNKGLWLDGFPRDAVQTEAFADYDPSTMRAFYLDLHPEQAALRTTSRIIDVRNDGGEIRADDIGAFVDGDGNKMLLEDVRGIIANATDKYDLLNKLHQTGYKMDPRSRYSRYKRNNEVVVGALEQMGVEVTNIQCGTPSPAEVSLQVMDVVGIGNLPDSADSTEEILRSQLAATEA